MAFYGGASTQQQGDKLRQRHDELMEYARQDGLLDRARRIQVPGPLKTAWGAITEFWQREENASAGVWDVLQGTGRPNESAIKRWLSESIGDTRVGNFFGVEGPSGETWKQVLEQGPYKDKPEKRLSGAIGDNLFTRFFDPSEREAAALAASIFLSSTTWFSGGVTAATKAGVRVGARVSGTLVGKAGTIRATPKAVALGEKLYQRDIVRRGMRLGVITAKAGESVAETAQRVAKWQPDEWVKAEKAVLRRVRDDRGYSGFLERGEALVSAEMRREALGRVADRAIRLGDSTLAGRRSLKFGEVPFVFGGIEVANLEPLFKGASALGQAFRSGLARGKFGEDLLRRGDGLAALVDGWFKRVPRAVRAIPAFRMLEEQRFVTANSGLEVATANMDRLFGKKMQGLLKAEDTGRAFMLAADNPAKYRGAWVAAAEKAGVVADEAEAALDSWLKIADAMGISAVKLGMLKPEQFQRFSGRYFPRYLRLPEDEIGQIMQRSFPAEFRGGTLGSRAKSRAAPDLDSLVEVLQRNNLDPDEVINWNAYQSMVKYMDEHVQAVANARFVNDLGAQISPQLSTVFRNLTADASEDALRAGLKVEPTAENLRRIEGLLSGTVKGAEAVELLEDLPDELKALYLYEATSRLGSMESLEKFLKVHQKVIQSLPAQTMARIQEAATTGTVVHDGIRWRMHDVGKAHKQLLPESVVKFMKEGMIDKTLVQKMPGPVAKVLRAFDLTQNSFKLTHTAIFPAFHVRNGISNVAAVMVETGVMPFLNPALFKRWADIAYTNKDFTIRAANGAQYTSQQVRNLMDALDIRPKRLQVAELTGEGGTVLSRNQYTASLEALMGKAGQMNENAARSFYFMTLLEQGDDAMTAARKVKEVLFDYNDLSYAEREVLRRMFPFYTWTRKNAELQVRNMVRRPGAVAAQVRVLNSGERGPDASLLPEFARGEMKVQLKDQGNKRLFVSGIDLPINNIDVLWAGGVGKTMRKHFEMFTPVIKAPLEWMLNLDTFSGQSIRGRRWMGQMGPRIDKGWPKWAKEWIELEKIDTESGRTYYKANGTKVWLMTKNLLMGRMVNDGVKALAMAREFGDGNTEEGAKQLLNVLTGMRTTEFTLAEGQRRELSRKVKELEEFLTQQGSTASFERVYRPANRKRQQQQRIF